MSAHDQIDATTFERTLQEIKLIVAQTKTEMKRPRYMDLLAEAATGVTLQPRPAPLLNHRVNT
jgi:hypothetical protein